QPFTIILLFVKQDFDCHIPTEVGIASFENDSHSTTRDFADEFVPRGTRALTGIGVTVGWRNRLHRRSDRTRSESAQHAFPMCARQSVAGAKRASSVVS